MTEFEEFALRKITKDYLLRNIYLTLNNVASRYGMSNAEISKRVGWDPAGFNQKYNRSNDLQITTFLRIFVAIKDGAEEKERSYGYKDIESETIGIQEIITKEIIEISELYNHVSAAAEGREKFLCSKSLVDTFRSMRSYVLIGGRNRKFNEEEIGVFIDYLKRIDSGDVS